MAIVYFSKPAERDLKFLLRPAAEKFQEELKRLKANPRAGKMLHGPLRGYFSYDFWAGAVSYRAAYEIVRSNVIILMVGARDNFYKKFSRRIRI
ncbi:MAG: type II toxin-antitoxin system RelE/ParE family toxin [Candidatus Sungbacteria bacterium]|nr:type II toxin-antitoxin system RelE/ParE family toxin [Candidatus Sungbacteria bacterium]